MDNEATAMRREMDETMAGLADKLGDLGHQVSGTVRTVRDSVNTVRDSFDIKLQVRRRPWAALAGAAALGFFFGFRPSNGDAGRPARNRRTASTHPAPVAAAKHACAVANDGTNGADAARPTAAAAPSCLANLGATFQPEIAALRGVAVATLLGIVRESIMKQAPKPTARPVRDANNVIRQEFPGSIYNGAGESSSRSKETFAK